MNAFSTGSLTQTPGAGQKRIRETFTTNPDGMVAKRFADWVAVKLCSIAADTYLAARYAL